MCHQSLKCVMLNRNNVAMITSCGILYHYIIKYTKVAVIGRNYVAVNAKSTYTQCLTSHLVSSRISFCFTCPDRGYRIIYETH